MQILVSMVQWGLLNKQAQILPLRDFFHSSFCPYLHFSIMHSGRNVGPIVTLYGSNDVFRSKIVLLSIRTMGNAIFSRVYPYPTYPQNWSEQAISSQNADIIKIAIFEKLQIRSRPNLRIKLRPTIRGCSTLPRSNSIWLVAAILKNGYDVITPPRVVLF